MRIRRRPVNARIDANLFKASPSPLPQGGGGDAWGFDPNLYKNTLEFELPETSTVTIGYHKDVNQNNYSHPVFDFKLEYFDPSYEGYDVTGVESVEAAATAAPEYYNLQGVRVANPQGGIFIVREGNKVSKRVIR